MEQFKTKYSSYDFKDTFFPIDEAELFIEKVKPLIIGQKIQKVLSRGLFFYEPFSQNNPITEQRSKYVEWDGPLIFEINDNHIEINLWQPLKYTLSLNMVDIKEEFDASKLSVQYISNTIFSEGNFIDITGYYTAVTELKIKDIYLSKEFDSENIPYLSDITIVFENGKKLFIRDDIDGVGTKIVSNAYIDNPEVFDTIDLELIFLSKEETYTNEEKTACAILINGKKVGDIFEEVQAKKTHSIASNYSYMNPYHLYDEIISPWWKGDNYPYDSFDDKYLDYRHAIMCCICGETGCDAIGMRIHHTDNIVIWYDFAFLWERNAEIEKLYFKFKADEYDAFMQKLKILAEKYNPYKK